MNWNLMLEDPRFWVAVAFVLFIGLAYKKIAAMATGTLDQRSAKIQAELDEVRHLREEAEKLLKEYKHKQAQYHKEAEAMLQDAKRDADLLRASAEAQLKAALDSRTKHALERIALEETKAVNEVRNHVVDMALSAAREQIASHAANISQSDLLQIALSDIEHKLH